MDTINPLLWWFAIPVFCAVAAKAYAEISNYLDPEYDPDLPENWTAEITRVGFWWTVKGIYTGNEFVTSEVVVSGWAWTRKSAVDKVARWIDEARSMPEEWMPEVQS